MVSRHGVPEVRVLAAAAAAVPLLLDEVRAVLVRERRPLLGFATGATFRAFLQALGDELQARNIDKTRFVATHLDEYLGFLPQQPGGMVHELLSACPPLLELLARGAFLPVPADGEPESLRAHEERLARAGGVAVQFVGVGRNGHLAFHEPGTPFDRGFHVATLADSTLADARARFALPEPAAPPQRAATAGIATILAARRLVLCAFGANKSDAVRAMLHGQIAPACPASAVRLHGNALVLLDRQAASRLPA